MIAIIPARSGSKGIPNKNLVNLGGRPLIYYTLRTAMECDRIDHTFVSTDGADIAEFCRKMGAEIINRPATLGADDSTTVDVVRHALSEIRKAGVTPDRAALLQPTSPLRTTEHLDQAIKDFENSECGSLISVTEEAHSPFKAFCRENEFLKPLFDAERLHAPRQELPVVFRQNGAIYLFNVEDFERIGTFFIEPAIPFIMNDVSSIDIDTEFDLGIAEYMGCLKLVT